MGGAAVEEFKILGPGTVGEDLLVHQREATGIAVLPLVLADQLGPIKAALPQPHPRGWGRFSGHGCSQCQGTSENQRAQHGESDHQSTHGMAPERPCKPQQG